MLETSKPIHQSRWKTGIQGGLLLLGTLLFSMVALGCASVISEDDNGLPSPEARSQERTAESAPQGWLGVGIQNIDEELANAFKLENTEGVLITKTFRNNQPYFLRCATEQHERTSPFYKRSFPTKECPSPHAGSQKNSIR